VNGALVVIAVDIILYIGQKANIVIITPKLKNTKLKDMREFKNGRRRTQW
jgi:hypothetical protein